MRERLTRTSTLVVAGVVALLLAATMVWVSYESTTARAEPEAAPSPAVDVERTQRVVSRKGGFRVTAPEELAVKRQRRAVSLSTPDKSVVVNVGPGPVGSLSRASRVFVSTIRSEYSSFERLGTDRLRVDGRPAVSVAGLVTNREGVRLRFVATTVQARPRSYTIAAFTAADSAPSAVLPVVNAVVNGFHVLPR